jgi:hypothetical protein
MPSFLDRRACRAKSASSRALVATLLSLAVVVAVTSCGKDDKTAPSGSPAAAAKTYLCPMDCEHGKVYPTKGICPVCKMDLEEAVEGKFAHSDHKPKHGGQFIMASDNFHHVEGTLPEPRKFVAWLYDNFSKPLEVGKTTATLRVMTKKRAKGVPAEYTELATAPGPTPTTLVADLPDGLAWPVVTRAVVHFEGKDPMTFDYQFDAITVEPAPGAEPTGEAAPHVHGAMDMRPIPTDRAAIVAAIRESVGEARALLGKAELKSIHTTADRIGRLAAALAMAGGGEGRMSRLAKDLDAQGDSGNAAGVTEVLGEIEKDLAAVDK